MPAEKPSASPSASTTAKPPEKSGSCGVAGPGDASVALVFALGLAMLARWCRR